MAMNVSAEVLERMLGQMPGVVWSSRVEPVTGKMTWIYVSSRAAHIYGITEAEMMADPANTMMRFLPEDRATLERTIAESRKTLAPWTWVGRLQRSDGEIRWLETQTIIEPDTDGTQIWCGQVLDVTERERAEEVLASSEAQRAQVEDLHKTVIEALPVGVVVMEPSGKIVIYNPAAQETAGSLPDTRDGDLAQAFGIFETDGVTPFSNDKNPILRALAGEYVSDVEMVIRNGNIKDDRWLHVTAQPIRDASGKLLAGMTVSQIVTEQRVLERELARRNEQLAASEAAKTALIERLRYSIDELSNPILEVWDDVLAMPLIGVVDSRRTADMVRRLLAEVARTQASFVIVDLTGVEIVDTKTADHLIKLIRKVELVGARCVLTGIRPAVAETLVEIGMDFGRITTLRNLKHGLREALRHAQREREQVYEPARPDEPAEGSQKPRPRAR